MRLDAVIELRVRIGVGVIRDADGHPRVQLRFPTWDDFVATGIDEIGYYAERAPSVERRLRELLTDVLALAPENRRDEIRRRLAVGAERSDVPAATTT